MVYNYVQHVRRQMHHEMTFCKVSHTPFFFTHRFMQGSAKDIWSEVNHLKVVPTYGNNNRTRRQADYGGQPVVNPGQNTQCSGMQTHMQQPTIDTSCRMLPPRTPWPAWPIWQARKARQARCPWYAWYAWQAPTATMRACHTATMYAATLQNIDTHTLNTSLHLRSRSDFRLLCISS